jgi:excinuclease UvrABC helicase subunit UvrB
MTSTATATETTPATWAEAARHARKIVNLSNTARDLGLEAEAEAIFERAIEAADLADAMYRELHGL